MATATRPGSPTKIDLASFSGGLNTRDSADELAQNESGDLFNVTFDERGGVGARVGFKKYNGTPYAAALVKVGFAWDTAALKVAQCGASIYVGTSTTPIVTFSTSARVDFADFLGSLYIIHPVDGLYKSDGTSGGTARVLGAPKGSTLAAWQNQLWAAGDPAQKPRVGFTVPGSGQQWWDAQTLINGAIGSLPAATITVDSTTGFDPSGAITIGEGGTAQVVTYTGVTATTFTGATGGTGAVADNTFVGQGQRFVDIREKDDNAVVCLFGGSGEDIAGRPGLLCFKRRSAYRISIAETGAYVTLDSAVGAASSIAAASLLGRVYTISEAGIFWTDGNSEMRNEGDKLRPLWAPEQLAFDQADLWCAGAKGARLKFSVPLVGHTANSLALEHYPAARPQDAATVIGSNAASCYFTSHASEERLFGGSPSVNGQVYEMDSGGTDDGAAIHSWFQTPWYPLTPGYLTRLRRLVVEGRGDAINLYVKRDFTTDQGDLTPITITLNDSFWDDGTLWDDGTVWGPAVLVGYSDPIPSLGVARVFAFRFDASTTGTQSLPPLLPGGHIPEVGAWAVQGLHISAIPLSVV